MVRVAKYESFLASRSVLVHEPHPIPPVPTPSPRPLSGTPLRPSPPPLPSCWNSQSPFHTPAPASPSPASSGKLVGAVWAKHPAVCTHYSRRTPRDPLPSDTPTPPLSSRPLPSDLPFPSVLVPAPSPPHSCPSPATSLGPLSPHLRADSPPIPSHPLNHHDTHSPSGHGRSRSPFTPLRPKKRAASMSGHVAHGTVPGCWSGSQLVSAVRSIFGCDFQLQRMPGSGLHRQVKVLWRNHRLAVNIWGTGRVHIQGKGASHFAQLLLSVKDHSLHSDSLLQQSPVLSESSPATGSHLPGHAGSVFASIAFSVLGVLLVSLCCWVGMFLAPFRCFMGSLGSAFLGSAISLKDSFAWHLGVETPLCPHFLFWRWSRSRHKRIRGIGSQDNRITARSKKPPFSILSLSRHVPFRVRHLSLIGRCVFGSSLSVIESPGGDPRFGRPSV